MSQDAQFTHAPTAKAPAMDVPGGAVAGRRSLILAACMMATFMAAMESTIVATAMPTIVAELGDFHLFSWVFAAYLRFQAIGIPIYGRLSDLFGRKRVFFAGAGLFLLEALRLCPWHAGSDRLPHHAGQGRRPNGRGCRASY